MRRIFALIMTLGVVVVGGATLAAADCAAHKTQAAVDKVDPANQVATTPTAEKTDATQVQTAQTSKPAQPVITEKK